MITTSPLRLKLELNMLESNSKELQLSSRDLKLRPELLEETMFPEEAELELQPLPTKINLSLTPLELNTLLEVNQPNTLLEVKQPNTLLEANPQELNTFQEVNTLLVLLMEPLEHLTEILVLLTPPVPTLLTTKLDT